MGKDGLLPAGYLCPGGQWVPGPQPAPHCHPPALGAVTNVFSECQCRLDPLGVPCHCTGAGGHSLRQPRAGPSPFLRTKGVRVGSLPCRAGTKRFRCALHVTGPAATAFSRPRPLQAPGLLERPVTTAQLFPPPATSVEPRLASALVPGPRPWAHPGFFSVVKIRQGQGAVEALGRLAAEGQAGLGPQWRLGACSLPPVSRGGAGPGGSQLAHVTGLWWGRTRTFCRSPRLLGFCGPLPSSQPPGPRGPGHLTRDRPLYAASSVPGLWKVGSQFQDPARCVAPGHGSLGRHSTSRGKASPSPAQRHALPCEAISILRGAGLKLVSESWEQRGFSPENVSVTLCGL